MVFSTLTKSYNCHHYLTLEYFCMSPKELCTFLPHSLAACAVVASAHSTQVQWTVFGFLYLDCFLCRKVHVVLVFDPFLSLINCISPVCCLLDSELLGHRLAWFCCRWRTLCDTNSGELWTWIDPLLSVSLAAMTVELYLQKINTEPHKMVLCCWISIVLQILC